MNATSDGYDEALEIWRGVHDAAVGGDEAVERVEVGGNGEGPVRADVGVARHGELAEEARALCVSERRRAYDVAGEENELVVAESEELAKHAQGDEREEDGSVLR